MPAVRLRRADVVRVGACRSYRLSIHSRHARSIYDPIGSHTIGKTIHPLGCSFHRLFRKLPDRSGFLLSAAESRPMRNGPALVWAELLSRFVSDILEFHREVFQQRRLAS